MADISEWQERVLPNYYTKEELDNPWYSNLGTANFWADKMFKNLGFSVGALYSGAAWAGAAKGLLGTTKVANNVAKGLAKKFFDGNVDEALLALKALNADVIDIGDNGIISPNKKKYPDAPKEVFEGFEKLTQEGKKKGPLRAFSAPADIDKVILQMPDNQFVVKRKGADGIDYIDYTSIESEATPVTKGEIFGIIALNGRNSK